MAPPYPQYSELYWYPDGSLAVGAIARVFPDLSNSLAFLYADAAGTIPLANPAAVDGSGHLTFYTEPGYYWVFAGEEAIRILVGVAPAPGAITMTERRIETGNVALPNTGGWLPVPGIDVTVPGVTAGDRLTVDLIFMRTGTGDYLDVALLDTGGAAAVYAASGNAIPKAQGNPAYYPAVGAFPGATATFRFVAQAGQIDGSGNAKIAMMYLGAGSGAEQIFADGTYPLYWLVCNFRQS